MWHKEWRIDSGYTGYKTVNCLKDTCFNVLINMQCYIIIKPTYWRTRTSFKVLELAFTVLFLATTKLLFHQDMKEQNEKWYFPQPVLTNHQQKCRIQFVSTKAVEM
jgi:hypothetical protein